VAVPQVAGDSHCNLTTIASCAPAANATITAAINATDKGKCIQAVNDYVNCTGACA
jgi:hypothetical protein